MRKVWEWLGNFNNLSAIAVICGVPVSAITTVVAGIWARAASLRLSYLAVLVLIVFVCSLWSWIGLVWLIENAIKKSKPPIKPVLDCAWGIAIDAAFLTFDTVSPITSQVSIQLRNLLSWPLRCEIIDSSSDVNGVIPNMKVNPSLPVVIMQGTSVTVGFDGYSQGTINETLNYKGKITIRVKYGHPDIGMSREMVRFYRFELQLQPNPFQAIIVQPLGVPQPPLVGRFPLILSHIQQEEDKPLS